MYAGVVGLASEFPNDNPSLHRGAIWVCRAVVGRPEVELPPAPAPAPATIEPPLAEVEGDAPTVRAAVLAVHLDELHDVIPVTRRVEIDALEPLGAPPEASDEGEGDAPAVEVAGAAAPFEVDAGEAEAEAAIVVEELDALDAATEGPGVAPVFDVVEEAPRVDSSELPPPSDDPFVTLVCTLADVAIGAGASHVAAVLPGLLLDARVDGPIDGDVAAALRAAGVWDDAGVDEAFVATARAWRAILSGTSDDFSACPEMLDEWAAALLARLLATPAETPALRQELRSRGVAAFGLSV